MCLASPAHEAERAFFLEQIRKSMRLHGTSRAVLMLQSDCGAYGGLKAFHNYARAESECAAREMDLATGSLLAAIPGLRVERYFVDFEGVCEVDLPVSKAAMGQPEFASTLGSALKVR